MYNLYAVLDKVENRYFMPLIASTDGAVLRGNLLYATRSKPLDDIEFYQLGTFDETTGTIEKLPNPRPVKMDSYKFSEVVAREISQTEYEKAISQYKLDEGQKNRQTSPVAQVAPDTESEASNE